MPPSVLSFNTS